MADLTTQDFDRAARALLRFAEAMRRLRPQLSRATRRELPVPPTRYLPPVAVKPSLQGRRHG